MPTPKFESVAINSHSVQFSTLLCTLMSMKLELLQNNDGNHAQPASRAKKVFYYATLSTQDHTKYYINMITLDKSPVDIIQDLNSFFTPNCTEDVELTLRTAVACFARLFLHLKNHATKGNLFTTTISPVTDYSIVDIITLLSYLNGGNHSFVSHQSWLRNKSRVQATVRFDELTPSIPVLSPLQLNHQSTIEIMPFRELRLEHFAQEYFELLEGLNDMKQQIQQETQEMKQLKGSYPLFYYAGIQDKSTVARPELYLMLSHLPPSQLLASMRSMNKPSAETQNIIRFATTFAAAQSSTESILDQHGILDSVKANQTTTKKQQALKLLHEPFSTLYSTESIQKLKFDYDSISYLSQPPTLELDKTSIKILYSTYSIHSTTSYIDIIQKVHNIIKHIQHATTQRTSPHNELQTYHYLGISQECDNTFHLILLQSTVPPKQMLKNIGNISTATLEERSILSCAQFLLSINKAMLPIDHTASQTTVTSGQDLMEVLSLLNDEPIPAPYSTASIEHLIAQNESYNELFPILPPNIPSELHLEHRSYITRVNWSLRTHNIGHFTFTSILTTLSFFVRYIDDSAKNCNGYLPSEPFFHYPFIAKNAQNALYINTLVSHKKPSEVLLIRKKALDTLIPEEQGIRVLATVLLQTRTAMSHGEHLHQIQKVRRHSQSNFMMILEVLNDPTKRKILYPEQLIATKLISPSREVDIISLSQIMHRIPYIPPHRHYANYLETFKPSQTSTLSSPRPHRKRITLPPYSELLHSKKIKTHE